MNARVLVIALAGMTMAAIVGCQSGLPSFTQQHPRAVLLTQGNYPPPVVNAPAAQNVYVYDDTDETVALRTTTATTQPTKIDLLDAEAFGGKLVLFHVNLSHHYSIYSEASVPPAAPVATATPLPAKPAVTTTPSVTIVPAKPVAPPMPAPVTVTPAKPAIPATPAPVTIAPAKPATPVTIAPAKPAAATPAPVVLKPMTKPVDPQITAGKVYDRGVDEWNAEKWDAARDDFIQAQMLGYKTGFGERSPEEFVRRIDKKVAEMIEAKQRQVGAGQPATQPAK